MKRDLAIGLLVATALAGLAWGQNTYQPGLLPNAKQQFTDANGAPLSGGKVYFYVPGTLTPSPTYQDPNDTVLNSNPVVLDSAGRGIIWGTGSYRQVVKDQFGNLVWDLTTSQINLASVGCPGGGFGQFQFFNQSGPNPNCSGASALTTNDQGGSVSLNAVQTTVQGVGALNILAGTTGGNSVSIQANVDGGGDGGAKVVANGGTGSGGGNLILDAGTGAGANLAGEIELGDASQMDSETTCTRINQDGVGGSVPSSRIYFEAGNGASGCSAVGAGVIEFQGNVQFDSGFNTSATFADNPSSGNTLTMPDSTSNLEIVNASPISTLTIQLPTCSAAYDGKTAQWSTTGGISTVTVTATAGSVSRHSTSTTNAYGGMFFICRGSNTTWYQQGFSTVSP